MTTGILTDGWERSETTNGVPYYIEYVQQVKLILAKNMTMLFIKLGCIEGLCVLAATISKLTYFALKYEKQRLSCRWSMWQYKDFVIL